MLNLNNKTIENFFEKKLQKPKLAYKIDKEVFLYISNAKRLEMLAYLREKLNLIYDIHIQALAYDQELDRNVLYIHHKKILDSKEHTTLGRLVKLLIWGKYKITLQVKLADYKQVWKAERTYTPEMFIKQISTCLKTKEKFSTPPLTKNTRKKLQEIVYQYATLRSNSRDCVAGKQVIIKQKTI